jgi:hypothetical protein
VGIGIAATGTVGTVGVGTVPASIIGAGVTTYSYDMYETGMRSWRANEIQETRFHEFVRTNTNETVANIADGVMGGISAGPYARCLMGGSQLTRESLEQLAFQSAKQIQQAERKALEKYLEDVVPEQPKASKADSLKGQGYVKELNPAAGLSNKTIVSLDPSDIRFSQNSVNGVNELAESMLKNGWVGDPIDVVRMSDGTLTSFDNTRLLAAQRAGINVQAIVHDATEAFPIDRWTPKSGIQPATWEEAIRARVEQQKKSFAKKNPDGSWVTGSKE